MTLDPNQSPSAQLNAGASDTMRLMAEAATLAGEGLLRAAQDRTRLRISEKSAGDYVSDADRAAEQTIAHHLNQAFPDYGWIGEESGASPGQTDLPTWIVDPLDGTSNFLKGLPHWAVSIALYQGDKALGGIIYDPVKAETFSAEWGKGAFLNGHPITVGAPQDLSSSLLATGVPAGGRITYLPHCLDDLAILMPQTAGIRRWVSIASGFDTRRTARGIADGGAVR